MDKPIFMLWSLLGVGIALAIVLLMGSARRSRTPMYVLWALLVSGVVTCIYGLSHSTAPSFAAQVSRIGTSSAFVEKSIGRSSKFVFVLVPASGSPINIETHIIVPHWGNADVFSGRTLRVTYLDDPARSVSNEAVRIEIVSGENAGWRDSIDARPFGVWLAIPLGSMIAGFGYLGLRYRRDDLTKTKASETSLPNMLA